MQMRESLGLVKIEIFYVMILTSLLKDV